MLRLPSPYGQILFSGGLSPSAFFQRLSNSSTKNIEPCIIGCVLWEYSIRTLGKRHKKCCLNGSKILTDNEGEQKCMINACLGSRKLSQEEVKKKISECCGDEDVSGPEKTRELLRNCCGQHSRLSKGEKGDERVQ